MVLLALVGFIVLRITTSGMKIYAFGGTNRTAFLSGIYVRKIQFAAYDPNGLIAGIATIVLSSRVNQAHPEKGFRYEMYTMAVVVIGAFFVAMMKNIFNLLGIYPFIKDVILLVFIVAAVLSSKMHEEKWTIAGVYEALTQRHPSLLPIGGVF